MENITDKEKLELLGFDDPIHSLTWYKERFESLPEILEQYILDTLNKYAIFPQEAKNLDARDRYHKFYLTIEMDKDKYVVKVNNTDRGEVQSQHAFNDIKQASKFLIGKSFTMGGSIRQYWDL